MIDAHTGNGSSRPLIRELYVTSPTRKQMHKDLSSLGEDGKFIPGITNSGAPKIGAMSRGSDKSCAPPSLLGLD